jgi:hypothetical protein
MCLSDLRSIAGCAGVGDASCLGRGIPSDSRGGTVRFPSDVLLFGKGGRRVGISINVDHQGEMDQIRVLVESK